MASLQALSNPDTVLVTGKLTVQPDNLGGTSTVSFDNGAITSDGNGNLTITTYGGKQSATAVSIANSGTITTAGLGVSRVTTSGAVTGVILQAGTIAGQNLIVVNESSNSITFAASGTSNVADGTSDVIAALNAREFVWDSGTSLWYHVN